MHFRSFFVCFLAFVFFTPSLFARSYPVKEVAGAFCEKENASCVIALPRILQADYLKYQKLPLYRQVYTVMWG